MKNKIAGKYIIYINEEYLRKLYQGQGACTMERQSDILHKVFKEITDFVRNTGTFTSSSRKVGMLLAFIFTDSTGKERRSFEIQPLLSANTLAYRMRLDNRKRKKRY